MCVVVGFPVPGAGFYAARGVRWRGARKESGNQLL
jgi:hypothetical protein